MMPPPNLMVRPFTLSLCPSAGAASRPRISANHAGKSESILIFLTFLGGLRHGVESLPFQDQIARSVFDFLGDADDILRRDTKQKQVQPAAEQDEHSERRPAIATKIEEYLLIDDHRRAQ